MAVIENVNTGERTILFCQHTIGRDPSNRGIIERKSISRSHAIIHWENDAWYLTDVSRNGTFVNEKHVCHKRVRLNMNDSILFPGDTGNSWKVIDTDQPRSFLQAVDSREDHIQLPEGIVFWEDQTLKTIYRDVNQNYLYDDGDVIRFVKMGESFVINQSEYAFVENEYLEDTRRKLDLREDVYLELLLSCDEEDVNAKIHLNDLSFDLGCRAYNQLLLQLVKIRQGDKDDGVSGKQSGWIKCKDLGKILSKEVLKEVDDYYINNLIYRLRKQVFKLQPYGNVFANIIERKNGKLRYGFEKSVIKKEEIFETEHTF